MSPQLPGYPRTRRDDVVEVLHDTLVADPYRWLEDGDAPEVRSWVEAQNARTRLMLDARPDHALWYQRVLDLLSVPVVASAEVAGDRLFVLERPEGAEQFRLTLRSAVDRDVVPRTLVDTGSPTTAIDWYWPSPDGHLVAYGLSEGGTEDSVLHVLDVDRGVVLDDRIAHTRAASVAWTADGFWYTRYPPDDEYLRRVYFHRVGDDPADDVVVWGDLPTPESWSDVFASPDGRYLLVEVMVGWGHVEAHLLDASTNTWLPVVTGHEAVSAFAFAGDHLVGMTTLDASRGRLVTASLSDPAVWTTIVPESDVVLGRPVVCVDELLVVVTDRAVQRVERFALDGASLGAIEGLGTVSVLGVSCDASDDRRAFITTTGFAQPPATLRWTPDGTPDHLEPWCGTSDGLVDLQVEQVRYPSSDGTGIGMFLIGDTTGPRPTILNGYGGFGITEMPMWSPLVAAWCSAGGVYAIAGLRGGLEEGEAWHDAGRRGNKQNVFDDFHAASDWLVAKGVTDRPGIAGGSNGGLLVATAVTQRPKAYGAVWCAVPLADMIRFPRFLIARLWTDEFGDPDVPEQFAWLWAYSPYHHVQEGTPYPAVLLTTAEGDTRVDPLHARKMAGALQWATSGDAPILLHQEGAAGHGVGKPVGKRAAEAADVLSFMAWQLGSPA